MVHKSYFWKQDLCRRKNLLLKYNAAEYFEKNEKSAVTVIEKAILYSAFIIRKLINSSGKLSDKAENYSIKVFTLQPLKTIDILNRHPEENNYDWENEKETTASGKNVCNWLIHSFVFFMQFSKMNIINSFYVSSDYDKNKILYRVSLYEWSKYIEYITTDNIAYLSLCYSEKNNGYVYTRKERRDF